MYWVQDNKKNAIWYIPQWKKWAIGSINNLGTKRRGLESEKQMVGECPFKATWSYYGIKWNLANKDVVNIACEGES